MSETKKRVIDFELHDDMTEKDKLEFIQALLSEKVERGEPINVVEFINVHMVFDGSKTKGWVHTHGLYTVFGLPDLEIRDVSPLLLMTSAAAMLNEIAQYMVDSQPTGKFVKAGDKMGLSRNTVIRFIKSSPINPDNEEESEGHFSNPRLQVVDVSELYKCQECGKEENHVH